MGWRRCFSGFKLCVVGNLRVCGMEDIRDFRDVSCLYEVYIPSPSPISYRSF